MSSSSSWDRYLLKPEQRFVVTTSDQLSHAEVVRSERLSMAIPCVGPSDDVSESRLRFIPLSQSEANLPSENFSIELNVLRARSHLLRAVERRKRFGQLAFGRPVLWREDTSDGREGHQIASRLESRAVRRGDSLGGFQLIEQDLAA